MNRTKEKWFFENRKDNIDASLFTYYRLDAFNVLESKVLLIERKDIRGVWSTFCGADFCTLTYRT